MGIVTAALPASWRYRVSARTGCPGVSIMWVGEVASLICSFCRSVVVHEMTYIDLSLWVMCWAHCPAWCSIVGSILLWGFSVEGIFPLDLTWVLTPFPQNSFRWEYKPRSGLCTHAFHHTDSKDLDIHVLDGWMPATKTPSMHHPWKWNMTTSMIGLKKQSKKKFTQNSEPKDIAGECRRRRSVPDIHFAC